MKTLQICPPYLSDAATLPWEIQKVIFQIKGGRFFWDTVYTRLLPGLLSMQRIIHRSTMRVAPSPARQLRANYDSSMK